MPPITPNALDIVPISTSTRPCRPKWSTIPRPPRPSTPSPWASSTAVITSWRSQSSTISGSFAMSPSMEKTPSVIRSLLPAQVCSCSLASRSDMSEWAYRTTLALVSLHASMMDAWFKESLKITSSGEFARVGMTAKFAQKPDCTTMAASAPLNSASFLSSSMCGLMVPAIVRTAPGPTPYLSAYSFTFATRRGSLHSPR